MALRDFPDVWRKAYNPSSRTARRTFWGTSVCGKIMEQVLLKAISSHKKRNKKLRGKAKVQLVACCWWHLSGTDVSSLGPIFLKDFINILDGGQENTLCKFADDTKMGVGADILRVTAFCLALVRLHVEYFVQIGTSQYKTFIDTMEQAQHNQDDQGAEARTWVCLTLRI